MRVWREKLSQKGIETTENELLEMWKKFDKFEIVSRDELSEIRMEAIKKADRRE